jgi:hypothetical protein
MHGMDWVFLYVGIMIVCAIWTFITELIVRRHPKAERVRDSGVSILGLFGGMVAVGFAYEINPESAIPYIFVYILVVAFGTGIIVVPSIGIVLLIERTGASSYKSNTHIANEKMTENLRHNGLPVDMTVVNGKKAISASSQNREASVSDTETPAAQNTNENSIDAIKIALEQALNAGCDNEDGQNGLRWRVLYYKKTSNRALVISNDIVDTMPYGSTTSNTTYSTWLRSLIRLKLNKNYLDSMPTSIKSRIVEVKNRVPKNPESAGSEEFEEPTKEKVFILSIDETRRYFKNAESRIAKYKGNSENWWLRNTTGQSNDKAAFVNTNGIINVKGYYKTFEGPGIRPAFWIEVGNGDFEELANEVRQEADAAHAAATIAP